MGALRLQDAVAAEMNARGVHEEDAEKQASELQKQIETGWEVSDIAYIFLFSPCSLGTRSNLTNILLFFKRVETTN